MSLSEADKDALLVNIWGGKPAISKKEALATVSRAIWTQRRFLSKEELERMWDETVVREVMES